MFNIDKSEISKAYAYNRGRFDMEDGIKAKYFTDYLYCYKVIFRFSIIMISIKLFNHNDAEYATQYILGYTGRKIA